MTSSQPALNIETGRHHHSQTAAYQSVDGKQGPRVVAYQPRGTWVPPQHSHSMVVEHLNSGEPMEAPPASLLFNNDEFNCNLVNLDEVDNLLAEMDYEITDEERA